MAKKKPERKPPAKTPFVPQPVGQRATRLSGASCWMTEFHELSGFSPQNGQRMWVFDKLPRSVAESDPKDGGDER